MHRYEPNFVVQMGDPQSNTMIREDVNAKKSGATGPWAPAARATTCPPSSTTSPTCLGTVAMARSQDPNSAGSQFYIVVGPASFLDGQYTVFGKVTEGYDEVASQLRVGDEIESITINDGSVAATKGLEAHVDQARFDEALKSYESGDYRQAAKGFLSAAGRGTAGNGSAYHYAGNSLMRLRRWRDAVTVYGHALRDEAYTKRGAVFSNLGQAYTHLAEYTSAIDAYNQALEESDFTAKYKAHQGMAAAYLEMGRHEDAASEYRTAALDPDQSGSRQGTRQPRPVLHGAQPSGRRSRVVQGRARVRELPGPRQGARPTSARPTWPSGSTTRR